MFLRDIAERLFMETVASLARIGNMINRRDHELAIVDIFPIGSICYQNRVGVLLIFWPVYIASYDATFSKERNRYVLLKYVIEGRIVALVEISQWIRHIVECLVDFYNRCQRPIRWPASAQYFKLSDLPKTAYHRRLHTKSNGRLLV